MSHYIYDGSHAEFLVDILRSGDMITDEQIIKAFKGTNFGPYDSISSRRYMVAKSIFKLVCGYSTGHTIACILTELGMTTKNYGMPIKAARVWAYHECFSKNKLP